MNTFSNKTTERLREITACGVGAWSLAACLTSFCIPGLSFTAIEFAHAVPPVAFGLLFLFIWISAVLLCRFLPFSPYFLLVSLLVYGVTILSQKGNVYLYFMVASVLGLAVAYAVQHDRLRLSLLHTMRRRTAYLLTAVAGLIIFAYLVTLTLCRYFTYSSPCYDFGIFAQMFHNMRETLLPMTTCERDGLLSHFAVHLSPIYYLFLPIYALIPSPATLIVMQAVFLFSGVIPLLLLARQRGLSPALSGAAALLYFAYPAMIGGCFYDLHENKMLLPLLLWALYFLERRCYPAVYLFAILVLFVKEDAPVYVAFLALYWLLARPRKRHGVILLVLSVAYFIGAVWLLEHFGEGAMFGRYNNLIGQDGSPLDLVRAALLNPALVLFESLNEEKLAFLAYMLLPLGAIPLLTRRWSRLILLCPMVLVNLMPDYYYQHDIGYQYTYGAAAFLFYLLVLNLDELRGETRRGLVLFALCATVLLGAMRSGHQIFYLDRAIQYAGDNARLTELLDLIPEDASVGSSTMFVAHLSNRAEVYHLTTAHRPEYIVFDLRPYVNTDIAGYSVERFEREGYVLRIYEDDLLAILQLPG